MKQSVSTISTASFSMVLPSADDFGELDKRVGIDEIETPTKTKAKPTKGTKRDWLKVWETAPAQMLNAQGQAKYSKMNQEQVWKELGQPQSSGAVYMTEYHSRKEERRGIATNRWLYALVLYCKYRKEVTIKKQNEGILNEKKCKELYDEIDKVLPSLEYCLAPKKVSEKKGSSSLRSSAEVSINETKPTEELCQHAKVLYDWLSAERPSRIRMLMNWQAAGGLSFVSSVHHLCTSCFRELGNSMHDTNEAKVTCEEFQKAILSRHRLGTSGMEDEKWAASQIAADCE